MNTVFQWNPSATNIPSSRAAATGMYRLMVTSGLVDCGDLTGGGSGRLPTTPD